MNGKKAVLLVFCLLFAASNMAVIIHAITSHDRAAAVRPVQMPKYIRQPSENLLPFISRQEYERIEHFKNYIMQLPKPSLDSFTQARPKLMDSILEIENYYQSQNKK